jgi:hypothetical protein
MKKHIVTAIVFCSILGAAKGIMPSDSSRLSFAGDFRFRVEQDWNSMKSNGSLRDDRTRFRYRVRLGLQYELKEWASVGVRLRTGDPRKQQDPQVTLGSGVAEFGLLPLGFEKAYFQAKKKGYTLWLGKNSFPFKTNNELFWSENVYPEGVFFSKRFVKGGKWLEHVDIKAGHFILASAGASLEEDAYLQGIQLEASFIENRLKFFPAMYYFNDIADQPDGGGTFSLDYAIANIGADIMLNKDKKIVLDMDYYHNLMDYDDNDSIPNNLKDQVRGYSLGLGIGSLKKKGDWTLKATYTYLERYAAVDFLAQNDWARWDYSGSGSPDGRLTNYQGVELMLGYVIDKDINLKVKAYSVEQLIAYGSTLENGNRIRFDIDIKF